MHAHARPLPLWTCSWKVTTMVSSHRSGWALLHHHVKAPGLYKVLVTMWAMSASPSLRYMVARARPVNSPLNYSPRH
jgi:hypothetical protein